MITNNHFRPWMSMLKACDQPFVGHEVVPADVTNVEVEFTTPAKIE